jgi:hypothetical protein
MTANVRLSYMDWLFTQRVRQDKIGTFALLAFSIPEWDGKFKSLKGLIPPAEVDTYNEVLLEWKKVRM